MWFNHFRWIWLKLLSNKMIFSFFWRRRISVTTPYTTQTSEATLKALQLHADYERGAKKRLTSDHPEFHSNNLERKKKKLEKKFKFAKLLSYTHRVIKKRHKIFWKYLKKYFNFERIQNSRSNSQTRAFNQRFVHFLKHQTFTKP